MITRDQWETVPVHSARRDQPTYRFGSFELRSDGTLLRKTTLITLPPKELAVLRRLLADHGKVVPSEELRRAGWGSVHVSPDSLPRCISSLRARLGSELCVATVYKRGYRFDLPLNAPAPSVPDLPMSRSGSSPGADFGDGLEVEARLGGSGQQADAVGTLAGRRQPLAKLILFPFQTGIEVPETLGSAIAEETMFRLSRAKRPIVDLLASTAVLSLCNRGLTALEAGVSLGADLAVAGTVTARPAQYRLRAEMFRVNDGVQVWVEDFLIPCSLVSLADVHMARLITARIGGNITKSLAGLNAGWNTASRTGLPLLSPLRRFDSTKAVSGGGDCLNRLRASAPLIG